MSTITTMTNMSQNIFDNLSDTETSSVVEEPVVVAEVPQAPQPFDITALKPREKPSHGKKDKSKYNNKKGKATFTVATSKIDQLKQVRREELQKIRQKRAEKGQAFVHKPLKDETMEEMVQSVQSQPWVPEFVHENSVQTPDSNLVKPVLSKPDLTATRPCHFVPKKYNEETKTWSDFGTCYRESCTFAHSWQEFRVPACAFGLSCYRKDNQWNPCTFLHPQETFDQYYTRTGMDKPDLPETSEKSRKPEKPKEVKEVKETKEKPKETKKRFTPTKAPVIPAKSAWNSLPQVTEETESTEFPSVSVVLKVPVDKVESALKVARTQGLTKFQLIAS